MEAMKGHKSEKSRRFQIVIMLSVALSIGACTGKSQDTVGSGSGAESQAVSTGKSGVTAEERALYTKEIAAMAEQLDRTYEDGWICGRNTRVHKSGYRDVSPQIKAQFAVAYQEMLNKTDQNLAMEASSYVPYSKRFKFALDWWKNSDAREAFLKEPTKKKLVWLQESMLDGSELFWRVFEKLNPGKVNSVAVMAHDQEQDMVYNYTEREGHPGSFSQQWVIWSDTLAAVGDSKTNKDLSASEKNESEKSQ
ncbi:MAG: hypothetical protein R3C24_13980 [Cyanobacteriota/Melainabacteria group bacterium]|nr:hypothetical protein [Cyanobacteria bacterium HKST-UBA01]